MNGLDITALILVIIGAINWGLIGFFNFNLISIIFGPDSIFLKVIYAIVGIAGIYSISFFGNRSHSSEDN